jgi:hypothetical protein
MSQPLPSSKSVVTSFDLPATSAAAATAGAATAGAAARTPTTRTGGRGVAVAAIDGAVAAGLEGDAGLAATGRAGCREHLTRPAATIAAATTTTATAATIATAAGGLAGSPAVGATARVREPAAGMEFLFARCEYEARAAVGAGQDLVFECHSMTSKRCFRFTRVNRGTWGSKFSGSNR